MAAIGPCEPWVTWKPPFTQGLVGPHCGVLTFRTLWARVFWVGPLGPSGTAGTPSAGGVPQPGPAFGDGPLGRARGTYSPGPGPVGRVSCFTALTPEPGSLAASARGLAGFSGQQPALGPAGESVVQLP